MRRIDVMSSADDILFAPLAGSDAPWRQSCLTIIEEYEQRLKNVQRRPAGALFLEGLMEAYHLHNQWTFYIVEKLDGIVEFLFNGTIYLTEDGIRLNDEFGDDDALELNLYPDTGNDTYVFADLKAAEAYERKIRV
jgi:hypothetical protein